MCLSTMPDWRICCGVDLVQALHHRDGGDEEGPSFEENNIATSCHEVDQHLTTSEPHERMSFSDYTHILKSATNNTSEKIALLPRHVVLTVSATAGALCHSVLIRPEQHSSRGLPSWSFDDTQKLASSLAEVVYQLVCLAALAGLDIGDCVRDKVTKNVAKYPAKLVKGSSAKYTAYTHLIKQEEQTATKHTTPEMETTREAIQAIGGGDTKGGLFLRLCQSWCSVLSSGFFFDNWCSCDE